MDSKIQPQHKDGSTLSHRGRLRPLVRRRKYNKTTIMKEKVEQLIKDLDGYQHLDGDQYSSGWNDAIEQVTELLKEIV